MRVNISGLKTIVEKLNLAVEKSTLNPKAGWIEMVEQDSGELLVLVGNFDYYVESSVKCVESSDGDKMHITVSADTFIPLVSKLDDGFADFRNTKNAMIVSTENGEYTFPLIKEAGKAKSIDKISFNDGDAKECIVSSDDISSISSVNAKGLVDSTFRSEIQQYIYVDEVGAITFTENIYINDFLCEDNNGEFRFLLNGTQAKLMKIFEKSGNVSVRVIDSSDPNSPTKVKFSSEKDGLSISLILSTQPKSIVDKFPSIKLRKLSSAVSNTHAVIDKKSIDKALQRLMVFDKKFGADVMNYSKLVFGENEVTLVSIKNNNRETVKYISGKNTIEHESIIRFADLINQLKAVQGKDLDISYGDSPAITINSYRLKQLIPEIVERT